MATTAGTTLEDLYLKESLNEFLFELVNGRRKAFEVFNDLRALACISEIGVPSEHKHARAFDNEGLLPLEV
jgi:hypothetical protein